MLEEEARKRHDLLSGTRRNPGEVPTKMTEPPSKKRDNESAIKASKMFNVSEKYGFLSPMFQKGIAISQLGSEGLPCFCLVV